MSRHPNSGAARKRDNVPWPNVCGLCGGLHPTLWMVPDQVWQHYIAEEARDRIVCLVCFHGIMEFVDNGKFYWKHDRTKYIFASPERECCDRHSEQQLPKLEIMNPTVVRQ